MVHKSITDKKFGIKGKPHTICQCHREIYHKLKDQEFENKDEVLETLKEAYEYGIRMSKRLHEYAGKDWIPEIFDISKGNK